MAYQISIKRPQLTQTSRMHRAMSSEAGEDGAPSHVMKHTSSGRPAKKGSGAADGNDAQHAIDVRSAFAGVPRLRPQWVHKYMTILVVGESGLGEHTSRFLLRLRVAWQTARWSAVSMSLCPVLLLE